MVAYGSSLLEARRDGWEDAYIDYDRLKHLLSTLEDVILSTVKNDHQESSGDGYARSSRTSDRTAQQANTQFLTTLQGNIEKVSLFALSRQGDLADRVGALRFHGTSGNVQISSDTYVPTNSERLNRHQAQGPSESDPLLQSPFQSRVREQREPLESPSRSPNRKTLFRDLSTLKDGLDETDQYCSVGVELLFILQFICINAMAIRKILKKYYKLLETLDPETTLEFLSPALSASVEQHGTNNFDHSSPDRHLQQLANSQSVAALQHSLQLALRQCQQSKQLSPSPPSLSLQQTTTNSRDETGAVRLSSPSSLIRLEGIVYTIATLREYAALVNQPFGAFLSKRAMIVTGKEANHNVVRGGLGNLEQPTQHALQRILHFRPNALLSVDHATLLLWLCSSTSNNATTTTTGSVTREGWLYHHGEEKDADFLSNRLARQESARAMLQELERYPEKWGGANLSTVIINLVSTLLYTVNYYIVAPTANHYAILLGNDGAFGSTLIGASSLAALFAAFLYSYWYTISSFRSALLFSSVCACFGNMLYTMAISYTSMHMAIAGRILVGFGSAEVVNRQLISACVSFSSMTRASALFVSASAIGMGLGPLLAAILAQTSGTDLGVDIRLALLPGGGIIVNHVTSPALTMVVLWFMEFLVLFFLFQEPVRINGSGLVQKPQADDVEWQTESDGSTAGGGMQPCDSHRQSRLRSTENASAVRSQLMVVGGLIFSNKALPVTLYLFACVELVDEVLISSCSMICRRYFGWGKGSSAGYLIAALGSLVLPAHFFVEHMSHSQSDRRIMKFSVIFIIVSLIGILNYEGMLYDIEGTVRATFSHHSFGMNMDAHGEALESRLNHEHEFPYDFGVSQGGPYVYILFLSSIFLGSIVLEGAVTSLMSKATPPSLNETFLNSGLLATLVGTIGRVGGDAMITISALVDRSVWTDFVNATYIPTITLFVVSYYLITRFYSMLV